MQPIANESALADLHISRSNQQTMLSYKIRPCTQKDIAVLVETIRKSFHDVAKRFDLTQENAPRHPSNCTEELIQKDMERGVKYFVIENENIVAGCVALEWQVLMCAILNASRFFPASGGRVLVKHWLLMCCQKPNFLGFSV